MSDRGRPTNADATLARQALGWTIVGGLSFAAVSTLYLTPVAYLLLARFSKPKAEEEKRLERELSAAGVRNQIAPPNRLFCDRRWV